MPRKKTTTTTTRTRKPRAATAPAGMVDTTEDTIEETTPRVAPPKAQRAGPKKVLNETGKLAGDAGAHLLVMGSGGNDGLGMNFAEAQSVTHPLMRLIGRHIKKVIPDWARSLVPTIKMDPDDLADLEEIGVTLGKYALRVTMLMIKGFVEGKEKAMAAKQQQAAMGNVPRPMPTMVPPHLMELDRKMDAHNIQVPQGPIGVVSANGHNPAFDVIGSDFGIPAEGA